MKIADVLTSRLTFIVLQVLDLTTTLIAFHYGAFEVNPLVGRLTKIFGPLGGVLFSKLFAAETDVDREPILCLRGVLEHYCSSRLCVRHAPLTLAEPTLVKPTLVKLTFMEPRMPPIEIDEHPTGD